MLQDVLGISGMSRCYIYIFYLGLRFTAMRILKILGQVNDPDNLRLRVVSGPLGSILRPSSEAIRQLAIESYDLD
jgi:hypothetical protein